jgi:homoserine kinase type II
VKTALSSEQARAVLRHYNLKLRGHGADQPGFWPLPRGTINSNYIVDTDAGPLFLRINEGKSEADAAFEAALIWHLGSHGVPTPALWRTRTGGPSVPLPSEPGAPHQPVMLMSWIFGDEKLDSEIDETAAHCVGELLARLHLATASLALKRSGIYTLRHITQRIAKVAADARAQAELGEALELLNREAERLKSARRSDLPVGLGHSDLFPDNFLFTRSHAGGVILDLEQAATVPYVYDLAVALLSFCAPLPGPEDLPPGAPDADRLGPFCVKTARALIEGYQSLRALEAIERQGLYEELRYAALRFTVTRLTDVHGYGHGHGPGEAVAKSAPPIAESIAADGDGDSGDGSAKLPRALRRQRSRHSKDHRDFLARLHSLMAIDSAALVSGLT